MATEEIERCYEAQYARLVGVVTVVTGSRALAEEAVQEAFARALDRSRRGLVLEHVGAWVVTVALNAARSGRRRRSVERRALQRSSDALAPAVPPDRTEAIALRAAIEDLPGRQQDAVVLYYLLDLDVAT